MAWPHRGHHPHKPNTPRKPNLAHTPHKAAHVSVSARGRRLSKVVVTHKPGGGGATGHHHRLRSIRMHHAMQRSHAHHYGKGRA